MNSIEIRFYEEFYSSMTLISQPHIRILDKIFWVPDFIDVKTNTYYEIVNSKGTFYTHQCKRHFEIMIARELKLVIAVYLDEIDKFFLFEWLKPCKLEVFKYYKLIQNNLYKRDYGDSTKFYDVNTLEGKNVDDMIFSKNMKIFKSCSV